MHPNLVARLASGFGVSDPHDKFVGTPMVVAITPFSVDRVHNDNIHASGSLILYIVDRPLVLAVLQAS